MIDDKWDRRFLELAKNVAQWSKDPSTKVGAILVNEFRQVVGQGYNGFPRGVRDDEARYADRELKYKLVVHAEVNAILTAGDKARGATLYVWPPFMLPNMCHDCCKVAIQAGIKEVVSYMPILTADKLKRWGESIKLSETMLTEAGISWRGVDE